MSQNDVVISQEGRLFRLLLVAFAIQVVGRLVDFWWHATHEEFETGGDQIQAHWLVWLGTLLVLVVAASALRSVESPGQRRGYWTVVVGNGLYVPVSVIHFAQHLNREEVDWAHAALGITNVIALVGVWLVISVWIRGRGRSGEPGGVQRVRPPY